MTEAWEREQIQHLFATWSVQGQGRRFAIDRAEGSRFHVPGHGWVWDLESQVYNVNVGHGNEHVKRRMHEQIDALPAAAPNVLLPVRAELARLLCRHTGMAKTFLTTGGAEAVENAVKIARMVTGRWKVVTRRQSYHGATLATLALAGDERKLPFAKHLPEPLHIEDPYPPRLPTADQPSDWVEHLEQLFEREGGRSIAAVLLEGFTGTNGMQHPPQDFWPRVRSMCDAHGALLIDDEVFAGFGRTGRWFAWEHHGVRPDIMVIGKGLTSGYAALAGVVVNEGVAAHFDAHKLWCGLTHYAHPVACAAAVGSIEVLDSHGLVDNAARVGAAMHDRLRSELGEFVGRGLVDIRGLGLMRALEFADLPVNLHDRLWEVGVFAPVVGKRMYVCPPLCLAEADMHRIVELIVPVIRRELVRTS